MGNNNAVSNVVPLHAGDRPGPRAPALQFERLLKECRDLACQRLSQSLADMLDKAGDTLYELTSATADREAQKLLMQAKDSLLPQRKVMEERFRSRYLTEFDDRVNRANKAKQSFSDYASSASLELGLVGEDDLNESLKSNEMAAKLRRYCEEELGALDQRVGVLLGDANLQADDSPFSPQAICDAFKHVCRDIEQDVKVRMVFVKLFDDHVLDDIRSIYKAVNALLVQNSILPKIRYGVSRNQDGGAASAPGGSAANPGAAAVADAVSGGEQDIFTVLQNLVAMNAKALGQAGAGVPGQAGGSAESPIQIPGFPAISLPGQAAGLLQGAALLGSLTRIQHGDLSLAGGALPLSAIPAEAGTTNVLRELKGTSVVAGMAQMDVATLDIVAMLFDQIFEDPNIPDGIKWLIGRLQIPMLKVAILDKAFFSTRTHPARQLLDTLGEIAVGLPTDFGPSSPLYTRLETIVQKLIDEFQDNLEIFDTLRQELQDLVAEDNQRVEQQTRDAAERMEQKERLAVAKAVAQDEIKTRAEAGAMPKPVRKFLAQQWVKLLLLAYAKRGKDGDAWKNAIEAMDQLIWSVAPKPSREERRKLAALLPGLLKRIAAGMQIVGTSEATRKRFFADLLKLHTEVMGGAVQRTPPPVASATAAAGAAQAKARPVAGDQALHTEVMGGAVQRTPPPVASATAAAGAQVEARPVAGDQALHTEVMGGAVQRTPPAVASATAAAGAQAKARPVAGDPVVPPPAQAPKASPVVAAEPSAPSDAGAAVSERPLSDAGSSKAPVADSAAFDLNFADAAESEPPADDAAESDSGSLDFTTVTVKNPFGEGEIRVDEIELPSLPGAPAVAVKEGDEYSKLASNLKEGTWLEFQGKDRRHQVKLSYVSPFKSAYLFVNRQGQTVGEYSLYELATELRAGRASIMEQVPLFDRAMSSLMGALRV